MKILFVCKNNVARSQMAKALFNKYTNKHSADSAGTNVEGANETLKQRADRKGGSIALSVMRDNGIDMSDFKKTQISKKLIDEYDLVINMSDAPNTPKWLSSSPNYTFWEIDDPKNISYAYTDNVRQEIEKNILSLIGKLENK